MSTESSSSLQIGFDYNGSSRTFSLKAESFRITIGKICFLQGRSGSGKTTLLNLISGVVESPVKFEIQKRFQGISYVMHESTLLPWGNVLASVAVEERLRNKKFDYKVFEELCRVFHLSDGILRSNSRHLSLGMRQRIEIAKGMSFDSDLLLLDEAFSGIDERSKIDVFASILEWTRGKKKSVVAIAHQSLDVLRLADEIVCIDEGSVSPKFDVPCPAEDRLTMAVPRLLELDAAKLVLSGYMT